MSNSISLGTIIALIKSIGGGGGSGSGSYSNLTNKPKINSVTLSGNKTGSALSLLDAPSTAGTLGQVLTSDGNGGQSWQTVSGGVEVIRL